MTWENASPGLAHLRLCPASLHALPLGGGAEGVMESPERGGPERWRGPIWASCVLRGRAFGSCLSRACRWALGPVLGGLGCRTQGPVLATFKVQFASQEQSSRFHLHPRCVSPLTHCLLSLNLAREGRDVMYWFPKTRECLESTWHLLTLVRVVMVPEEWTS